MSAPATAVSPPRAFAGRSREALSALAVLFLLGMAVNLIGEPSGTFGIVVDTIFIILHILIAIGLVVIGVRALLAARKAQLGQRAALWGLIVIIVTFLAGVGTMISGSDWASYIMSVGFLVAARSTEQPTSRPTAQASRPARPPPPCARPSFDNRPNTYDSSDKKQPCIDGERGGRRGAAAARHWPMLSQPSGPWREHRSDAGARRRRQSFISFSWRSMSRARSSRRQLPFEVFVGRCSEIPQRLRC